MAGIKSSFYLATIPLFVGLSMMSAVAIQVQSESQPQFLGTQNMRTWKISQNFKPQNRGTPTNTAGGATRGSSCVGQNQQIISLIPKENLSLTASERPKFFWYISQPASQTAEFVLLDDNEDPVYNKSFPLPKQAGIFALTLPNQAPGLKAGKQYHWYLSVNCGSGKTDDIINLDGWVERIKVDINLQRKLNKSKPQYYSAIYAEAGIWYEALASLAQQRCTYPNDAKIISNWSQLLTSVGLNDVVSASLNNICKI